MVICLLLFIQFILVFVVVSYIECYCVLRYIFIRELIKCVILVSIYGILHIQCCYNHVYI